MPKQSVSIIITDLDNTLFDWVRIWHASFSAMLEEVVRVSGVDADILKREIREIHQKHGTSEYAFLLEEIPSLKGRDDVLEKFAPAILAYRIARREQLALYPSVMETLKTLKESGCLIIAYTESMAFYTNYRIRHLALDGIIDVLYSPRDHELPKGLTPEQIRKYPAEHYELKHTLHRHTPEGELKPNPAVLKDIISDLSVSPEACVYIGDSLWKDVAMAQDAGVKDVYAAYGCVRETDEYELLREVTHWSDEDVRRERKLKERDVNPTFVMRQSFSELLNFFTYRRFGTDIEQGQALSAQIEVWKKTVDVQEHFNDIEMRIRGLLVTILSALLTAFGFSVAKNYPIHIPYLLLFISALAVLAFYLMDRFWYHRLLYGAVTHGNRVEKALSRYISVCDLAGEIGKQSPVEIRISRFKWRIRSPAKIDIFYGALGVAILIAGVTLAFAGGTLSTTDLNQPAAAVTPPVLGQESPLAREACTCLR